MSMASYRRYHALFVLASAASVLTAHAEVVFDYADIGNAGNSADPLTGLGAVAYEYRIATTEVTNAQYAAFLNAADPTGGNALSLYNSQMAGNYGGIELNAGNANGSKFVTQAGRENNPVTWVSWIDAARFVNWLHNGQGPGDTESGVYAINDGLTETRAVDARYFLPSEDEWYKAAYHDKNAGAAADYFLYATGSNDVPISDHPDDDPGAVNYFNNDKIANGFNDGFALSGSTTVPKFSNPLTDVGAYPEAASPYGTFDQNGNVMERTEGVVDSSRVFRGSSWSTNEYFLRSTSPASQAPTSEDPNIGFRIASPVPEPMSAMLLAAGIPLLTRRRRG